MLISKKHNFIFIHIYKNAGTSITTALLPFAMNPWQRAAHRLLRKFDLSTRFDPQPYPAHIRASELAEAIGKDRFRSCFSFAIVRNPWDWQVSLYKYMLKDTGHRQHDLAKTLGSFENYIRWRCANEVRFQTDFIYSDEGELLVDFVGRYENLDADFKTICARIGIAASLPRLNVSNTTPYRQYYSRETETLVRNTFARDIELLEYEF